jgi:hypothetical protein
VAAELIPERWDIEGEANGRGGVGRANGWVCRRGEHEKGRDKETTVPVAKLTGLVVQAVWMVGEEWEEERLEVAGAGIVQGRKE